MVGLSAVADEAAHFVSFCQVCNNRSFFCKFTDSAEGLHFRGSGKARPLSAMSGGQLLGHKGDSATGVPLISDEATTYFWYDGGYGLSAVGQR